MHKDPTNSGSRINAYGLSYASLEVVSVAEPVHPCCQEASLVWLQDAPSVIDFYDKHILVNFKVGIVTFCSLLIKDIQVDVITITLLFVLI